MAVNSYLNSMRHYASIQHSKVTVPPVSNTALPFYPLLPMILLCLFGNTKPHSRCNAFQEVHLEPSQSVILSRCSDGPIVNPAVSSQGTFRNIKASGGLDVAKATFEYGKRKQLKSQKHRESPISARSQSFTGHDVLARHRLGDTEGT